MARSYALLLAVLVVLAGLGGAAARAEEPLSASDALDMLEEILAPGIGPATPADLRKSLEKAQGTIRAQEEIISSQRRRIETLERESAALRKRLEGLERDDKGDKAAVPPAAPLARPGRPGWQAAENRANCLVWNYFPTAGQSATWDGPCRNGFADGRGTLVWLSPEAEPHRKTIFGDLRKGRLSGRASYRDSTGLRYEGRWSDGHVDGEGTYTFADGARCGGRWKKGRLDGVGEGTLPDGRRVACWDTGRGYAFGDPP